MNIRRTAIASIAIFFIGGFLFRNQIARAMIPLARGSFLLTQGIRKTFTFFENRSGLLTELDVLRNQVQRLSEAQIEATLLRTENQELRALLAFKKRNGYTTVSANVVGLVPEMDAQGLILDRGSNDGLASGMPVVTGNGLLIGELHSVTEHASTVLLLTDPRSSIAVTLGNAPGTHGVVTGGKGFGMRMELIPQQDTVSVGDLVFTSGLESGIPRGIAVGIVMNVTAEERRPFQTATIRPLEEYDRIITVTIITSGVTR